METKKCNRCAVNLPISHFDRKSLRYRDYATDPLKACCRDCLRKINARHKEIKEARARGEDIVFERGTGLKLTREEAAKRKEAKRKAEIARIESYIPKDPCPWPATPKTFCPPKL